MAHLRKLLIRVDDIEDNEVEDLWQKDVLGKVKKRVVKFPSFQLRSLLLL